MPQQPVTLTNYFLGFIGAINIGQLTLDGINTGRIFEAFANVGRI
jgi:hypothetical protein